MTPRKSHPHDGLKRSVLTVRLTPRAKKNEIVEILNDGTVKIHVTAPPVNGQANEVLLKFLGHVLGVARSQLEIVAGATGRNKMISVIDMDSGTVHKKIINSLR